MATSKYEQATEGLRVGVEGGVVRVRNGTDTWVVPRAAWEKVEREMVGETALVPENGAITSVLAYTELRTRVARGGLIASVIEESLGGPAELARLVTRAVEMELLDPDEPLALRFIPTGSPVLFGSVSLTKLVCVDMCWRQQPGTWPPSAEPLVAPEATEE